MGNLDAFLASGPSADTTKASASSGNDDTAVQIAAEVRGIATQAANRAPRSLQVHLGPSELGVECDRQVVGKLLQLPATNHVSDPWPSIVGTAVHAWMDDTFSQPEHGGRWLTETRVVPHPDHSGTADLYDTANARVLDHKCLGASTMNALRTQGPPRHYYVQLLLYALGYVRAGYPVTSVAIIAWPRTESSLAGVYVWHHTITEDDWRLVGQVLDETQTRKDWAALVQAGAATIDQVPRTPGKGCHHCPQYRPQSAVDGGVGCPGQLANKT